MKEYSHRWKVRSLLAQWGHSEMDRMTLRKQLDDITEEVKSVTAISSPNMDGMPHAQTVTDATAIKALKLDELEKEYGERLAFLRCSLKNSLKFQSAMDSAINSLKQEQKDILKLKYALGKTYENIAYETSYSVQAVKGLEAKAVDELFNAGVVNIRPF